MFRRFAFPFYDVPEAGSGSGTANSPSDDLGARDGGGMGPADTAGEAIRQSVASTAGDDTKRREAEIEQRKSMGAFEPKPRICRIVEYHDVEQGWVPAVINQVNGDGGVHVCAFDPVFGPRNFVTSGKGDDKGQWRWPSRD